MVAEALRCGPYRQEDEQIVKEWTKDYNTEATTQRLGESLCYDGQTKWRIKDNYTKMAAQMLGQNVKDKDPTKITYNHLVSMTRTKAVTLTIPDNIYHILEFTGVAVRMFLANFVLEQYNWRLSAPSVEGRSEEDLRSWPD